MLHNDGHLKLTVDALTTFYQYSIYWHYTCRCVLLTCPLWTG